MTGTFSVPVVRLNQERWGDLSKACGNASIDVVAYKFEQKPDISFKGQHRHRLIRFWKDVHFKIARDAVVNLDDVELPKVPDDRAPIKRRHHKG